MAKVYAALIKKGLKTIDDVPENLRDEDVYKRQEYYSMDRLQNIANSTFYEDFANWVEAQEAAGNFPELPEGMHPEQLSVLSSGYMFDEDVYKRQPPKEPSARSLKNRTLANEEGSLVTRTPLGHPVTRTPRSSASCPSISQRRHWNCCT